MIIFCLIIIIIGIIGLTIILCCDEYLFNKFRKNTKLNTIDILNCKDLKEVKIIIKAKEYELKLREKREKDEKFTITRGS